MPRKCTVCYHEKRAEIEEAILKGDTLRAIATNFNVSTEAVRRHKNNGHMGKIVLGASEVQVIERSNDLFSQIEYWSNEIQEIYRSAKDENEKTVALNAIDKAMKIVALTGQMKQMFYEVKAIKEFQEEIIKILGEVSPKARKTFIQRVQERRGVI